MDILNFISWIASKRRVVTSVPDDALVPVGIRTENRDDKYTTVGITASNFASQVGGLQTVSVDNVTITGNGTPANPLVAIASGEYTYEIGEYVPAQGGVIFHRYKDGGQENYLVVAINYSSTSVAWDPRPVPPQLNIDSTWNGLGNTQIISSSITPPTIFSTAAYFATNNTSPSMPGWYLPSIDELSLLYVNRFNVNRTLSGNSTYGTIPLAQTIFNNTCWSSRESGSSNGWAFVFGEGAITTYGKNTNLAVRAVRRFSI